MGLQSGQFIFTSQVNDVILFAAWWPWGSGDKVSVRIGLYDTAAGGGDFTTLITDWFSL